MHAALLAELPGLAEHIRWPKELHEAPGRTVEIETLSGKRVRIRKADHRGGWRRILSGWWSCCEAEAMDYVLANLPIGARVVTPMFDGLLVCCAAADAERVAARLRAVMLGGCRAAGFVAGVKVGVGNTWAAAENGAV